MSRDSILNEAQETEQTDTQTKDQDPEPDEGSEDDGSQGKEKLEFTARMPVDLVEDIERVQEEYALPSRMAAINFILKQVVNDF